MEEEAEEGKDGEEEGRNTVNSNKTRPSLHLWTTLKKNNNKKNHPPNNEN